ncbi:MAG: hypothetical protein LBQ51_07170 [Desulfovibrio sp.]|jgi:hypothetical protein|nr:hypothetical protein [Desulfovibrio sp.]
MPHPSGAIRTRYSRQSAWRLFRPQAAPAILGESESSAAPAISESVDQDTRPEQAAASIPKPSWLETLPETWPDVQTLYRTASLEDLLREIRHRLPDADIRITLPIPMPEAEAKKFYILKKSS